MLDATARRGLCLSDQPTASTQIRPVLPGHPVVDPLSLSGRRPWALNGHRSLGALRRDNTSLPRQGGQSNSKTNGARFVIVVHNGLVDLGG